MILLILISPPPCICGISHFFLRVHTHNEVFLHTVKIPSVLSVRFRTFSCGYILTIPQQDLLGTTVVIFLVITTKYRCYILFKV